MRAASTWSCPGRASANPWLQAFAWIRQNTPADAYFALDPDYLAAPGEDYHSFRALAERSQMADDIKDTAVVTQVPELGRCGRGRLRPQKGWTHFQLADFERLKAEFGVNWVLVAYPPAGGAGLPLAQRQPCGLPDPVKAVDSGQGQC